MAGRDWISFTLVFYYYAIYPNLIPITLKFSCCNSWYCIQPQIAIELNLAIFLVEKVSFNLQNIRTMAFQMPPLLHQQVIGCTKKMGASFFFNFYFYFYFLFFSGWQDGEFHHLMANKKKDSALIFCYHIFVYFVHLYI